MTRWLDPPQTDTSPLSTLDLPLLLKQTLIRRGTATPDSARAFLHPEETPSMPFPEIENAVEIIYQAIQRKDRICVWGDFDVDGQTSTALLVQTLQSLGANVVYYIPIRGKESHGVHIESLAPIIDGGIKLLITCDTGITAHDAIDYANSRGVNVVLTDHHDVGETLPNAKAIINPKLLPQGHPLKNLAGVGVAYKLAEALLRSDDFSRQKTATEVATTTSEDLLDLVALGLIADVALLQSETRSLAQTGIRQPRKTNRLGLKVMAELSNTQLESLTEETIGFTFAPRLIWLVREGDAPKLTCLVEAMRQSAFILLKSIDWKLELPGSDNAATASLEFHRQVFLLFREAVHNIARHAKASGVKIQIFWQSKRLHLHIEDDGCGFDVNAITAGNGLANLRHRAEALGGVLCITSEPGKGTHITLEAPLMNTIWINEDHAAFRRTLVRVLNAEAGLQCRRDFDS